MLTVTSCGVHTYDCTYTKPLPRLDARITFHQECIGDAPVGTPAGVRYAPLPVLVAELGVPRVDLLKMCVRRDKGACVYYGMCVRPSSTAPSLPPSLSPAAT